MKPYEKVRKKRVKDMKGTQKKNWMRNKPCPCGSEKKFKVCCWSLFK